MDCGEVDVTTTDKLFLVAERRSSRRPTHRDGQRISLRVAAPNQAGARTVRRAMLALPADPTRDLDLTARNAAVSTFDLRVMIHPPASARWKI